MGKHDPTLTGAFFALCGLAIIAPVYYLMRLGEWITRGKGEE